jgi:hemolysin activation/secretion protein
MLNYTYNLQILVISFFILLATFSPASGDQLSPPDITPVLESTETDISKPEKKAPKIDYLSPIMPESGNLDQTGSKILVSSFLINGMTVFTEKELAWLVEPYIGQLYLSEIREAAGQITEHYHHYGYFGSYAYIPAQDVKDNQIIISILEAEIGQIKVTGDIRLKPKTLEEIIRESVSGGVLEKTSLERGLFLANELPGIKLSSRLSRGQTPGTVDITLDTSEESLINGHIGFDNYGSRFIGDNRLTSAINLNDILGIGDKAAISLLSGGNGMLHQGLTMEIPVTSQGTVASFSYTRMNYDMRKEYRFLEATGSTQGGNLALRHPLERSRLKNSNIRVSLGYSEIEQKMFKVMTRTDKPIVFTLGYNRSSTDFFGGGGRTAIATDLTSGATSYTSDLYTDPPTEDRHFQAVHLNFSRLQQLWGSFKLNLTYSSQFCRDILISSEQFALGGPRKVRAYSQGSGDGDWGYLGQAEIHYDLPQIGKPDKNNELLRARVKCLIFADQGKAVLRKTKETSRLKGWGAGINISSLSGDFAINLTYARKSNRDHNEDSDEGNGHFWAQLIHFYDF